MKTISFKERCQELEEVIQGAYTNGSTVDDAEKAAGNFLLAQMEASSELAKADLNARMRKSGLKAVKAATYLDTCSKSEKKPTEAAIEHTINLTPLVNTEQEALDIAEVTKAELERYYDIFREAHVYFRQVSKGVQG